MVTPEDADLVKEGIGALSGGGGVLFLANLLFKSWKKRVERLERNAEKDREARSKERAEDNAWRLQVLQQMTMLVERVDGLLKRDKTTDHAVEIAVLKERADKTETDVNNLGAKLRGGGPRRGPG